MNSNDVAASVGTLSSITLASVLDQSVDCVKLIGLDGDIQYMNQGGRCAMEIEDFSAMRGKRWADLWPAEARQAILSSYSSAAAAEPARFRAFCPTTQGKPRWWDVTVSRVDDATGRHAGFLAVSRDVTENQESREALQIAAAEMKHRLKNTYTMICSLLAGFARGDPAHEAFASAMADRLRALSTAQSLFIADEAPCEITKLIPALVLPFDNQTCPVVVEQLAEVMVEQGQANAIALALGELCVNSAKHGALAGGGSIHVISNARDGELQIDWIEHSGRPADRTRQSDGQGLQLIERIVRARHGTIRFDWTETGLVVRLTFKLAQGKHAVPQHARTATSNLIVSPILHPKYDQSDDRDISQSRSVAMTTR